VVNEWLKQKYLNDIRKPLHPATLNLPPDLTILLQSFEEIVPPALMEERYRRELLRWLLSEILRDYMKTVVSLNGENRALDLYAAAAVTAQYLSVVSNDMRVSDVIEKLQNQEFLQLLHWEEEWVEEVVSFSTVVSKAQYFRYRIRGINLLAQAISFAVYEKPQTYYESLKIHLAKRKERYISLTNVAQPEILSPNRQSTTTNAEIPKGHVQVLVDDLRSAGVKTLRTLLNANDGFVKFDDAINFTLGVAVLAALVAIFIYTKLVSLDVTSQTILSIISLVIIVAFLVYRRKRRALQRREGKMTVSNNMGKNRGGEHIASSEEIG